MSKSTPSQTPMMQQYTHIKSQYEGFLLFYRMGDFYELFGEDACAAARILNITLTQRRSNKESTGIPMCGVPFHAAENYIAKLLQEGFKVALCEQTESPQEAKKARGSKALVNREVIRLYTKGTLTEESMLPERAATYLSALYTHQNNTAFAWLDLAGGTFHVITTNDGNLLPTLSRINPSEILLDAQQETAFNLDLWQNTCTTPFGDVFSPHIAEHTLKEHLSVSTLDGFGFENTAQIAVCGALVAYIAQTQKMAHVTLPRPQVTHQGDTMHLDPATCTNLELTHTLQGKRKGSLLHTVDLSVTAAGARLMEAWLNAPLRQKNAITARQDVVTTFLKATKPRKSLRQTLKTLPDLSRALSRLNFKRGGPRDMANIRQALTCLPELETTLKAINNAENSPLIQSIIKELSHHSNLSTTLNEALNTQDLPLLARDGDFIAQGHCPDLDTYRMYSHQALSLLQKLERDEAEKIGVSSLKIKFNKVWGYYIELTKAHAQKVPTRYIHRQTTTQTQRFTTEQLLEIEQNVSSAGQKAQDRELELYEELRQKICAQSAPLLKLAQALAELDVFLSMATLAEEKNLSKPEITEDNTFEITAGRHSVVEETVETFIPNSCTLNKTPLWLVTGPNMAGKSTFLRQNALLAILAHVGCYIPAKKAKIGLIDRIFTRIGAADDLARGQSTFMVEMVETANILNNATEKSLVILDEIGRGTATYDGLSIAWACVEQLLNTKCRTLFATHYHELTQLEEKYKTLSCHHVAAKEWQGEIIFLHEVQKGAAPRSYGVHVGRLAGLPQAVTQRAESILTMLEERSASTLGVHQQISLFGEEAPTTQPETAIKAATKTTAEATAKTTPKAIAGTIQTTQSSPANLTATNTADLTTLHMLDSLNPDTLSPIKALEALYALKKARNETPTHPTQKSSTPQKNNATHTQKGPPCI